MGWLLLGALIIVVLLGTAATVVYVTVVRGSDEEQARILATKGSLALAQAQMPFWQVKPAVVSQALSQAPQ